MLEFLDSPRGAALFAWLLFLLPTLCLIYGLVRGNKIYLRRLAERKGLHPDATKRSFLRGPETSELSPWMKLLLHVVGFIAFAAGGYWVSESISRDFSDLETGKVASIKVHSLIAFAYNLAGASGAVAITRDSRPPAGPHGAGNVGRPGGDAGTGKDSSPIHR